jgi:hypothetical protein
MENAESRIMGRYFRKTKADPEGGVAHLPGCSYPSAGICDCALLRDLREIGPGKATQLYSPADLEIAEHDWAISQAAARMHIGTRRKKLRA